MLGGGSWGTTVASMAARRNQTILWARDPEVAAEVRDHHTNRRYLNDATLSASLAATADIEEAVTATDVLVVGVPSHGFRDVLTQAQPFVRPWIPVVSLTKGLEAGSLLRMTQVIEEVLPGHPAAALTGPNLAREILAGHAAASVIATEDPGIATALQGVLRSALFRLYLNHDVIGCEIGGALKNVIAIASGIAQGLKVGDNTRAAVITRGLAELTRLGVAMGGDPVTLAGLAGMGDLVLTCTGELSRNRTVGFEMGKGRTLGEVLASLGHVAEGVKTAKSAHDLAVKLGVEMPITREVHAVLYEDKPVHAAVRDLMARELGYEFDPRAIARATLQ